MDRGRDADGHIRGAPTRGAESSDLGGGVVSLEEAEEPAESPGAFATALAGDADLGVALTDQRSPHGLGEGASVAVGELPGGRPGLVIENQGRREAIRYA